MGGGRGERRCNILFFNPKIIDQGLNDADEVKTVDFGELVAAVEKLGIFRAAINEPPPNIGRVESGHATVPENEDDHNGIPASYPASGG